MLLEDLARAFGWTSEDPEEIIRGAIEQHFRDQGKIKTLERRVYLVTTERDELRKVIESLRVLLPPVPQ